MKLSDVTRKTGVLALATALGGVALGIGVDRLVLAQQEPIKRTMLIQTDAPGGKTHDIVMAVAELAPGATSGNHRHPGVEVGYVIEGSLVLEHEGRKPVTLKAGDSFKNDGVHNGINKSKAPVKILAVYVVEKGKPVSEPVK